MFESLWLEPGMFILHKCQVFGCILVWRWCSRMLLLVGGKWGFTALGFWSLTVLFFFPEPDSDSLILLFSGWAFFSPGLRASCEPDVSLLSLEHLLRISVKWDMRVPPEEICLPRRMELPGEQCSLLGSMMYPLSWCLVAGRPVDDFWVNFMVKSEEVYEVVPC